MKFLKQDRIILSICLSVFLSVLSALRAEVTIMPLGNSITWGKLLREDPTVTGTHGYRKHLFDKLSAQNVDINFVGPQPSNPKYDAGHHDPPYEGYFRDGARLGFFLPDSTWDVEAMLDNMDVDSIPEMVILHLGTNDMLLKTEIGDHNTPGTITYRLKRLMDVLLGYSRGGHQIDYIFLCTIIPRGEDEGLGITYPEINQRINTYNSKIRVMMNDNASWNLPVDKPRVKLIDTHSLFLANMSEYYTADIDPTHPNSDGYRALAEDILFPVIYKYIVPGQIDEFDRAAGALDGSNRWQASSTIQLSGTSGSYANAIYNNSATGSTWDNLAIWPLSENASTIEMTIHEDAGKFNTFGMAIALNDTDVTKADGYLIWHAGDRLRLWTINNGQAANEVTSVVTSKTYSGGDRFRVNFRHNKNNTNSFDIMINGEPVTTVHHAAGTPLYSDPFYSGVLFKDGSGSPADGAAMVSKFNALFYEDNIDPGQILGFTAIEIKYNSVILRWNAPGDDAYEGTATRYDLRVSTTALLSAEDIENADVVGGLPTPLSSGNAETFMVRNLSSGQQYFFYIRAIDDWGNAGPWSDGVEAVTQKREPLWYCFENISLMSYDPDDYKLDDRTGTEGEFTNARGNLNWPQSVAVFKGAYNPSTVQLVWGDEVTYGNPPSIDNGGIACMLNSDQPNADGYVIFIRTAAQSIFLWTISNGHVDEYIGGVPYIIKDSQGNPKYPGADDTLKVVIDWSSALVNRFDVFVNSEAAGEGALFDKEKKRTATGQTYAGLYLSGLFGISGRNNNVKCFGTLSEIDDRRNFEIICPASNEGPVKTELPDPVQGLVTDGNNNPVSNWPVYFELTEDQTGGSIDAPAVIHDPIRMEAEWGSIEQNSSTILAPEHHSASRGKYVEFSGGTPLSGYVEFNFYVAEAGDYYFWARVVAEDWQHSVLGVQLDGKPTDLADADYWALWTNQMTNYSDDEYDFKWDRIRFNQGGDLFHRQLNVGMHKLKIFKWYSGVKLDKILLTRNTTYQPVNVDTVQTLFTDSDGLVTTSWTLGEEVGANVIKGRAFDVAGDEMCTAYGTPGAPKYINPLDPDEQTGAARDTLDQPFGVVLTDQYGNITPDVTVNWNVTEGDGIFKATGTQTCDAVTDENGQAFVEFVLGIMDSVNTITATFTGHTGSPIEFEARVTSGLIYQIQVIAPEKKKHYVNATLPNHVKVKIVDDDNKPVQDVPVYFSIAEGDAEVGAQQPKMTAADGTAQDTLKYGRTSSVVKVQAQVSSLTQEIFTDSVFYRAEKIKLHAGQNGIAQLNDTLQYRMYVRVSYTYSGYSYAVNKHPVWFRTRIPRDQHNWKFPGEQDSVRAYTNANGVASATIRAPMVHGFYEDIVEAVATNGFSPLSGSPVKFSLHAQSKASKLIKFSQDSLEGVVAEPLQDWIVVRMLDGVGDSVTFQPVKFSIEAGNGHFQGMSSMEKDTIAYTNEHGYAGVRLWLGPEPGEFNNIVKVTATDGVTALDPKGGLFYRFSAKSSHADTLFSISDEHVSGRVDEVMNKRVQVKVADAGGWGVDGVSVTFSVLSGGGSLGDSGDTTATVQSQSTEGIASVQWKLGNKSGTDNNVLEAKSLSADKHLKGSPVLFYASGLAADVDPDTSIIATSGATVASGKDTCWITVTLRDPYENPVDGKEIKIKVTGGADGTNFYDTKIGPTNEQGQAVGHLISLSSGEKVIEATVVGDNIQLTNNAVVNFDPNNASKIQAVYSPIQAGNVGTVCQDSLAVKVMDSMGNPVPNKRVYFNVQGSKGGSLTRSQCISDANGIASTYLIFGDETGEYIVRAVCNDQYGNPLDGSPLYFTLSGKQGTPVSIFLFSGDKQEGPAGSILPDPLVVGVLDVEGKPVANVKIQFEVEEGDGQIMTTQPVETDMYGHASALLRTGTKMSATCWVKAEGANNLVLSNAPVRFSAKSISGIGSQLVKVSGDEQTGKIGETLPNPLTVKVTDAYGNAVSNKSVKFTVVQGAADFQGESYVNGTSNSAGLVSKPLTLGYTTGDVIVQVSGSLLEGSPMTFSAEITTNQADDIVPISDQDLVMSTDHYLPSSIKVQVQDQYGNGVPDISVYFKKDEGGGQLANISDLSDLGDQFAESNENGVAEIQYKAGDSPGLCRVRAVLGAHTIQFTIDVRNNGSLPVLNKAIIPDEQNVHENDQLNPLNVILSATDADGNALHFEVEQVGAPALPDNMSLIRESAFTARIRWVPGLDDAGTYEFIARVVDTNGGFDDKQFTVVVLNSARPPLITDHIPVPTDTVLLAGQEYRFWIDAYDPDYEPLTYTWSLDAQSMGENSSLLVWNIPMNLSGSIHTVKVIASDGLLSASQSWSIEVVRTGVELTEFYAEFDQKTGCVELNWCTSCETKNTDYDVYRSTRETGEYMKLTETPLPSNRSQQYRFSDNNVKAGAQYFYKLVDIDQDNLESEHGPICIRLPKPDNFVLYQNYPNPFNPITTIRYEVPRPDHVKIIIYNMLGQMVVILVDQDMEPGYYLEQWDGRNSLGHEVSTGLYLYRLQSRKDMITKRMVKMK